ncbi:MAG: hypothetical protein S4CHLAM2_10810 [Chlamydiales bacterium]|nr:hypothetical protein [Chlamydiales bacterium]
MKSLIAFFLFISPFFIYAETNGCVSESEPTSCCPREWYASVDALYWTVGHAPIFAAIKVDNNDNPDRQPLYMKGTYDGGARARFGFRESNKFADISYLNFYAPESKFFVRGDAFNFMIPSGGRAGTNSAVNFLDVTVQFRYQNVDLRYGVPLPACCHVLPFAYAHVRWVRVDYTYDAQGELSSSFFGGSVFRMKQHSGFQGGGLGLGLGGTYPFWKNFNLRSNLGLLALIGSTYFDYLSRDDGVFGSFPTIFTKRETWNHVIPGLDFQISLNYNFCLCRCFAIALELGYELDWYADILNYSSINLIPQGGNGRVMPFSTQSLSLGGPFFRLTVGY